MDKFEQQLKVLIKYVQERLCAGAFVMYQPEFITIAYFDANGGLNVLADVKQTNDTLYTFSQLYAQINEKLRLKREFGHEM